MTNSVIALRGPVLSSVYKSSSDYNPEHTTYIADALILLSRGKITDYGSANYLSKKIPHGTIVKTFNNCRIIKTIKNSL